MRKTYILGCYLNLETICFQLESKVSKVIKVLTVFLSGNTTGYIPIYDWTQAIPSLSYAGNTYNINLQMYNSPVRLVPVPLNEEVNE